MQRIIHASKQLAPFQLEVAAAVESADSCVTYNVVFTDSLNNRPAHWAHFDQSYSRQCAIAPYGLTYPANVAWAIDQLEDFGPQIILLGQVRGVAASAALRYKRLHPKDVKVGYWLEQPIPRRLSPTRLVRTMEYRYRLSSADFVLAIGDRAYDFYNRCSKNVHLIPYGSDLSTLLGAPQKALRKNWNPVFLFSGKLEKRHNFDIIMEAFAALLEAKGPCFSFIVSGDGPEQAVIDSYVARLPRLRDLIIYEREFTDWTGRLSPFLKADVLLYPTHHAGWGIVVPEAMAAGLVVIASRNAESARYLIQHNHNGILIKQAADELYKSLLWVVENPDVCRELSMNARRTAALCDATSVARQLLHTLKAVQ